MEPSFKSDGSYDLSTPEKQLAAAVAALRSVVTCATAYYGQGPEAVSKNMEHAARSFFDSFGQPQSPRDTPDPVESIPGTEVVLGDVMRLFPGPYGWGTVVKIEDGALFVWRPYVHIADFTYTGGVLHYIGTEMTKVPVNGTYTVDRNTHKRMTMPGALK